jgi:sugar/nucleoside kinase (ribokinase family)
MILCGGETLIDFIPTEARDGTPAYLPANGGSVHNVAYPSADWVCRSASSAASPADFFGEALASGLRGNGVSLAHVRRLDGRRPWPS